jgi:hypothetical protein
MKFGIAFHGSDLAICPADLAREAEARGFDSLYLPEHTHIPVSRRTPAPTGDAELPDLYRRTLDPYVALAAAASVTTKLRLGTGVALPAPDPAKIDYYRSLGCAKIALRVPSGSKNEVLPALDEMARLVERAHG